MYPLFFLWVYFFLFIFVYHITNIIIFYLSSGRASSLFF